MSDEVRTTGLFLVAGERDTVARLTVFLSNQQPRPAGVTVTVTRADADGTKQVVREENVAVGPRATARLPIEDGELEGQVLEVAVADNNGQVLPAVSISRAREGSPPNLEQWIAPREFNRPRLGSLRLTTGLIPVNRPGEAGTPPWVYTLEVFVSSWATTEERITVRVNRTLDLWGAIDSEPLLAREQAVPAGGTARVLVENIAGNTVEANVELSSPRLLPSAVLSRGLPDAGVQQVLLWIGPSDFVAVPASGDRG